jgi:hypothetical protein
MPIDEYVSLKLAVPPLRRTVTATVPSLKVTLPTGVAAVSPE